MNYIEEKRQRGFVVAAWVGLGLAATSLVVSVDASKKAAYQARVQAEAQKESIKVQGRESAMQAQKERIRQVRAARLARAQVLSGATVSGMGAGTSGVAGAMGSIGSQLASNIGSIGVSESFAEQASAANIRAANAASRGTQYQAKAQQWAAIGEFGKSIFGAAGGSARIFGEKIP